MESDENQDPNRNEDPKSPKGWLVTRKYGLKRKNTNQHKYTCAICGVVKRSTHKINEHHRETHPSVLCDICGKECSTPLSLERHRYSHNEQPYQCDTCKQGFQFASELVGHWIKHCTIKAFMCAHAKCSKSFMQKSKLTAHSITHSGKKYECECGNYEMNDKRLNRQHQRTHSEDKRYSCKVCGERFKHTTQVLWHKRDKHYLNKSLVILRLQSENEIWVTSM